MSNFNEKKHLSASEISILNIENNNIKESRETACNILLSARKKKHQIKAKIRRRLAIRLWRYRNNINTHYQMRFNEKINQSIQLLLDTQNAERYLFLKAIEQAQLSLSRALPELLAKRIDWPQILSEIISDEIKKNKLNGDIEITKNENLIINTDSINATITNDSNMDIDTIVMENQYIRITLSPKKQIENALANFKLKYNTLLDE
ncbi:hypothetical protein MQ089_16380 [Edwardsiella anguillarum]|uniref:hypothetical protein n=1 Tax=Edwardsiella anguillarum TaxID=1821960 RepID=UPI0024B6C0DF|nr:hypothetical protein [Edwardsiella anguillarum]WHP79958.1 hypothetical protein MQ090_16065 [Edwardsiella anguillarum]WHQ17418.1 hypothetical protein MQ085_16380 [Edwardsiella anguillarum]WHQ20955.1 hypothetical protein MQ089_16380 [Edwardsiella anguillarum]WHQ24478.1 hypothetical protein MQ094_16390 [Edwardsiella anguillarum]WHQ28046.1 hypothetical protein MQ093_16605 [Edwardsiella anguillarum]